MSDTNLNHVETAVQPEKITGKNENVTVCRVRKGSNMSQVKGIPNNQSGQ